MLFTDDPVVQATTAIKAVHITELRQAAAAMRATAGLTAAVFTDPGLAAGSLLKAVHVEELRTALTAARTTLGLPLAPYTDATITPGVTTAKAAHLEQLRAAAK